VRKEDIVPFSANEKLQREKIKEGGTSGLLVSSIAME
jgi:hypothetical protein